MYYSKFISFKQFGENFIKEKFNEEDYHEEYNYNYEKNVYQKNNKKKEQINHTDMIDMITFISNTFEETYHLNIFHTQVTTTYVCCMCKITLTLNNKLHQHI